MREIKFRAWSKIRNKMLDCNVNMIVMWPSMRAVEYDGEGKQVDMELVQFTGLKDKNGVDIYEGDIVNLKDYARLSEEKYRYAVVSLPVDSGVKVKAIDNGTVYGSLFIDSVIGNIHQNKELLK